MPRFNQPVKVRILEANLVNGFVTAWRAIAVYHAWTSLPRAVNSGDIQVGYVYGNIAYEYPKETETRTFTMRADSRLTDNGPTSLWFTYPDNSEWRGLSVRALDPDLRTLEVVIEQGRPGDLNGAANHPLPSGYQDGYAL